jgi:hypothetical protein
VNFGINLYFWFSFFNVDFDLLLLCHMQGSKTFPIHRVKLSSLISKKYIQRSKLIGLKTSLYHWKALRMEMSKMGSHDPFGCLKHKLWPKEGLGIKVPI